MWPQSWAAGTREASEDLGFFPEAQVSCVSTWLGLSAARLVKTLEQRAFKLYSSTCLQLFVAPDSDLPIPHVVACRVVLAYTHGCSRRVTSRTAAAFLTVTHGCSLRRLLTLYLRTDSVPAASLRRVAVGVRLQATRIPVSLKHLSA